MKLIMGMSSDGYVAREPDDCMDWLGSDDKAAFRILTSVGGDCFVSRKTRLLMPVTLPGRTLYTVTREPDGEDELTLQDAAQRFPEGWLLGGQHLALVALRTTLIDEAHLCVSGAECLNPIGLPDRRIADLVSPMVRSNLRLEATNRFGMTTVMTYRPASAS